MCGIIIGMDNDTVAEIIAVDSGDDLTCLCGNTVVDDGFYPVNEMNEIVEPNEDWQTKVPPQNKLNTSSAGLPLLSA